MSLYIESGIQFTNKSDLKYLKNEMESLFIEADGSCFDLASNLATMSEECLSILFADDWNLFISAINVKALYEKMIF